MHDIAGNDDARSASPLLDLIVIYDDARYLGALTAFIIALI
jgi:hypothetical protein